MAQEPELIRAEIETTRDQMGETVDALAQKADVKSRVKGSISGTRDRVKSQFQSVSSKAGEATPDVDMAGVKRGAGQAVGIAQENPLGLAIGGIAVGFLAGLAMPVTRIEAEKVGPIADDVKSKAMEAGTEALEHGKEVARDTAQAAAETAKESGSEHMGELKESAQEKAGVSVGDGSSEDEGTSSDEEPLV
jgi:hypothetical protein